MNIKELNDTITQSRLKYGYDLEDYESDDVTKIFLIQG